MEPPRVSEEEAAQWSLGEDRVKRRLMACGQTWGTVRKVALNRVSWRSVAEALCSIYQERKETSQFGFGDSRKPLQETAVLVEEIVHQQMVTMLQQAGQASLERGEKGGVGMEDVLFLLRKDKVKLRRLLRYYEVRDLKTMVKASMSSGEDAKKADINLLGLQDRQADRKLMSKTRQMCYDFLSSIDQTGELVALFDDKETDLVKHERMMRAELQSQGLDQQQYIDFCKARQVTFSQRHGKSPRFKEWLLANLSPEVNLSPAALELFSYLAFETIAQVVDLSLLVKQDQRAKPGDPMSRTRPALCVNYKELQMGTAFTKGDGGSSSSVCLSPTSEPSLAATALSTQFGQTSTSSSKSGSKKKRKKSGPPTSVDVSWDSTILPSDVREAMRRYYTDISPFASDMKKNSQCSMWQRTLCS